MNFDFLKHFDFKSIILEIKECRKGAPLVIFIICICCALVDFLILRKAGITWDWFGQIYAIIAFICFNIWAVKLFNQIADKIEAKRIEKAEQKEYEIKINNYYKMIKPVLNNLEIYEHLLLKKFLEEKSLFLILENTQNILQIVNQLNAKLLPVQLTIKIKTTFPNISIFIDKITYDVLVKHFTNFSEGHQK